MQFKFCFRLFEISSVSVILIILFLQIDVNRRREEEISKLKNDLETSEREHGESIDALKKKLTETQLMLEEAQDLAKKTKAK